MYSYEERMRAVKLFIQYDHSFASIKRELGYPNSRVTLNTWFAEYQKTIPYTKISLRQRSIQ